MRRIVRKVHLAPKVVFIDGQPGCGKTMLSPIVSAMDRVELMSYAFEIEFMCRLFHLEKVSFDAAEAWSSMFADHKLYQGMMGREMNCRYSDLSSAFQAPNPQKYLSRLFGDGDETVPARIEREKPILHFATHNLLAYGAPVFSGLGSRAVMIEVVRHPLYMVKQLALNMERLPSNPRDIDVYFEYNNDQLPYFVYGWEDLYNKSNFIERAIYCIQHMTDQIAESEKECIQNHGAQIITIPFEQFVLNPTPFIKQIEEALDTHSTDLTHKEMERQKVPRKMIADGISLDIYKRCGWEPPKSRTEREELNIRRVYAEQNSGKDAIKVLDQLSQKYENDYLTDILE